MYADLYTLATALYVRIDYTLKYHPELCPWRPRVGIAPPLSYAELFTLAVLQVLLRFDEEARWVRHARRQLRHLFPYLPGQAGYNKRLRKSATQLQALIRASAQYTDLCADYVSLIDSTPVECGRSRPTALALRAGRVRALLLLRQPLPLLLGPAAAPGRHPPRPAGHLRVGQPQYRRTRRLHRPARLRPHAARRPRRPDPHRRQALRLRPVRGPPQRPRHRAGKTGPPR